MIRTSMIGLALMAALVGCGTPSSKPAPTPEQKAEQAKSDADWKTPKTIEYNGNPFEFAVDAERTVAFIAAAKDGFEYTPKDLEAIARSQTGCKGKFQPGVLAFIGGFDENSNLAIVKGKGGKKVTWSISLTC